MEHVLIKIRAEDQIKIQAFLVEQALLHTVIDYDNRYEAMEITDALWESSDEWNSSSC